MNLIETTFPILISTILFMSNALLLVMVIV